MEKMTRNSNALKRDGSVMADSDLVDFLSGSTDSAINFSRSADLHLQLILPHLTSQPIAPDGCKVGHTNSRGL